MTISDYSDYDGLGLAGLVTKGDVSPVELVDAAIARIEKHNGVLNAVVHKAYDEARTVAAGDLPAGPFKGVPFLIKDLGAQVKGWPRTSGSRFAQVPADEDDSELVRRYRQSGVVLLGKSNTPEFGIPGVTNSEQLGPCRNPWNPDHITGGSSGGAAAATAAGIVPLAHASDGLGSIRIPAACCGLVGMKITRDRTPICEVVDGALGFSVHHVVSRTVRDSAAMLDATGYAQPGDLELGQGRAVCRLDSMKSVMAPIQAAWVRSSRCAAWSEPGSTTQARASWPSPVNSRAEPTGRTTGSAAPCSSIRGTVIFFGSRTLNSSSCPQSVRTGSAATAALA